MDRRLSWLMAGAAVLAPLAVVQAAPAAVHRFHQDHVLGTSLDMTVVGADAATAARALAAARAEIARLDKVLSGWRPDSELARLNAARGPIAVSPDLYRVIAACEAWREACGGAFSARLGAVEAVWREAELSGKPARTAALTAKAKFAERAEVRLDPQHRTIDRAGVTFSPDALAKGYIIDAALDAAGRAAPAAKGLMLDIGGDLRCRGAAPDGQAWRIGLARGADADNLTPDQAINVSDRAVATSGPGARDRRIGACAFSHTLDPASGHASPAGAVTVVAGRAADADALATALSVLPPAQGLALASSHDAQARIVDANGLAHTTSDWDGLTAPVGLRAASEAPRLIRAAAARTAAWPAGFEVAIDYEIPVLNLGRYKPPFVVIWITDDQGKIVRTLFHLGNHPNRFLDSNYVWFGAFNADGTGRQKLDTVTRPSRQPGKYTAAWDGKDDMGNPVGQGRYTINVETSREHGGHTVQAIPLTLGAAPTSGSAQGGQEAGPAAARYGRPTI